MEHVNMENCGDQYPQTSELQPSGQTTQLTQEWAQPVPNSTLLPQTGAPISAGQPMPTGYAVSQGHPQPTQWQFPPITIPAGQMPCPQSANLQAVIYTGGTAARTTSQMNPSVLTPPTWTYNNQSFEEDRQRIREHVNMENCGDQHPQTSGLEPSGQTTQPTQEWAQPVPNCTLLPQTGAPISAGQPMPTGYAVSQGHPQPTQWRFPPITIPAGQMPCPQSANLQAVIYTGGTASAVYEKYNVKAARWLGVGQIIVGILLVALQIAGFSVHAAATFVATGLWCAVIFIIAGSFGVQSSRSKSRCTVITTMVMSIIAAVFTVGVVTQTAIGVALDFQDCIVYYSYHSYTQCDVDRRGMVAVNSMMLILGVVEAILGIVASIYCCSACCCGVASNRMVLPVHVQFLPNGQQIFTLASSTQQGPVMQPYGAQFGSQQYGPCTASLSPASSPAPPSYTMTAAAMPTYETCTAPPEYTEKEM